MNHPRVYTYVGKIGTLKWRERRAPTPERDLQVASACEVVSRWGNPEAVDDHEVKRRERRAPLVAGWPRREICERVITSLLLAASMCVALAGEVQLLNSPDGRIQVSLQMPAPGSVEPPHWSATFRAKPILTGCGLGLQTADAGDLMAGARVLQKRSRSVDEHIAVLFGKSDHANARFRETRFTLETPKLRRADVIFRCYDDAVALRYELPADQTATSVTITNETTSFRLEGEPTAFVQYLENYHLGGFRAVPRAAFKPRNVAPNVLGTRGHMLALYVCFENPNPMVADYPTAYEGEPGFDFLKLVPTWWDETRVLTGQVGELLVTARRKGTTWYLGAMSAKQSRELALPLSFLGAGRYTARIWKDASDAESEPNHLTTETLNLSSADTLRVHLALDGGFVAQLDPARN